ncbi:MAG: GNAT family N-acetyltransferase [Chlorobi bacterium]|nr:GNAT family N-acetyltransferase [Chlorobiota bacterium]
MAEFTIREGTEKDFPAVLEMIKELAEFEKSPEKVTNTIERMKQDKDFFHLLIAEDGSGKAVGFALFFPAYFTWTGRAVYLDDVYVKPAYRGKGIGTALIKRVIEKAKEWGATRVRWHVLNWNTNAIELYKKLGAEISDEWLMCEVWL